jgi:hypothetical protein
MGCSWLGCSWLGCSARNNREQLVNDVRSSSISGSSSSQHPVGSRSCKETIGSCYQRIYACSFACFRDCRMRLISLLCSLLGSSSSMLHLVFVIHKLLHSSCGLFLQ